MLSVAEWVALLGAITAALTAVIKSVSEVAKTRAEVAGMRADIESARLADATQYDERDRLLRETHHELTPNGGGSLKDSTTRLESAVVQLHAGQGELGRRMEAQAADLRGIRRDVGRQADAAAHLAGRVEMIGDRLTAHERDH